MQTDQEEDDRRRYFRIDDRVALSFTPVEAADLPRALANLQPGAPGRLALASSFAGATLQMRPQLERLRRDEPEIVSCLETINDKLDMLIRLMALGESGLPDQPTHDVSLSGSGFSFHHDDALVEGTQLDITLLLFPEFLVVRALAVVVHCVGAPEAAAPRRHTIGVDFTHIRESDREMVVRHVLQRQSSLLREARIALDTPES